jgi:arylsulfatase A
MIRITAIGGAAWWICVWPALLVVKAADELASAPRTNIVLMLADNLGYGDLGCYGNSEIQTPCLDALARQGTRCTDFYVVTSSCTPSRGALLTGRYPQRNGLTKQLSTTENWTGVGLPHRERILPEYLRAAGYATACFGKWNIGFAPGSRPTERGFDEFFGCRSGNIHYFKHTYHGQYDMFRGTERFEVEGYSTDLFADAACEFIRQHQEQPFLLYLPFNAPHYVSRVNTAPGEKPQWQVPEKYLQQYGWTGDDQVEKHRYLAVLTALDAAVGRVLQTLDHTGLSERTLVIFLSDMGAVLRPDCGLGVASNGTLRDGAPSVYEGGVRVPAMVRWPSRLVAGSECPAVLSQLDLLPLCLSAAGVAMPSDRLLDGVNPLPWLGGQAGTPHESLVFEFEGASALRTANLKLVRPSADKPWELYDLALDPSETRDLAPTRPKDVARLETLYDRWREDTKRDASLAVVNLKNPPK